MYEQTKAKWRQVVLKRGVEGAQQMREDIDKMCKTQEAKTKEQMNRVQNTFETVVQISVRKSDSHLRR